MMVQLIKLFLMALLVNDVFTFPMEGDLFARFERAVSSHNTMNCNSRSFSKRIIMSNLNEINGQDCRYAIRAFNTNVCQLRIDFRFFHLAQPSTRNGTSYAQCSGEHLSINGLGFNLCGLLNDQHIYVDWDVKFETEEKILNFDLETNSKAMWFLEANQIECTYKSPIVMANELEAPKGCLQYFYKSSGHIESFNFGSNYLGNHRYAICFDRKQNNNAVLVLNDIVFKMSGSNYDDSCLKDVHDENLSEDYVSMSRAEIIDGKSVQRHNLFCGNSLNGKMVRVHTSGPIVIQVNTDDKTIDGNETGFKFRYRIDVHKQ